METAEIISRIREGLKKCSEEYSIDREKIRIRIERSKGLLGGVKLFLMEGKELRNEVKLGKVMGLSMIEEPFVSGYLDKTLCKYAEECGIDKNKVNARLYTEEEDFTPSCYLYNEGKAIKEITIEELTSAA
jgi:hypothetical protein